jgi:hypothetical protein
LFLALAFGVAAPAGAQIVGKPTYGDVETPSPFLRDSRGPTPPIGRELRDIRGDIDRAREAGTISGREARQLRRQGRLIGSIAGSYGRDGFSDSERLAIQNMTLLLRSQIYAAPNRARRR